MREGFACEDDPARFAQGETVSKVFRLRADLSGKNLTGLLSTPNPQLLTIANQGINLYDAATGVVVMNLTSQFTASIIPGIYPLEFFLQSQNGALTRIYNGTAEVYQSALGTMLGAESGMG